MLLRGYTKHVRAENNPNLASLHCFAELEHDIGVVLPYLKRIFEDVIYSEEMPFLTLKMRGKKVTVYSRKSVINALKDEEEADVILKWLQSVVNETWENRLDIKKGKQKTPKPYEALSPE